MDFRNLRLVIVIILVLSIMLTGCSGIIGAIGNTGPEDEELPSPSVPEPDIITPEPEEIQGDTFKGIWVSRVINLD